MAVFHSWMTFFVIMGLTYRIRLEKKKGSWNHWQVRGKIISQWKNSDVRGEEFPISSLKFTLVPTPIVAKIPHLGHGWWESCWMVQGQNKYSPYFTIPLCVTEDLQGISRGKFHCDNIGPVCSLFFFVDSPFHLSYAEPLKHHVQRRNKRQSGKTWVLLSTVTCFFSVFFTRA